MAKVSEMFPGSVGLGRKVQEKHVHACLKGNDDALLSHRPWQVREGKGGFGKRKHCGENLIL